MNALASPYFANQSTIYYRALIQSSSTATATIFGLRFYNDTDSVLTSLGYIGLNSGGMFAIQGSSGNSVAVPFAASTTYYVCGKFQSATSEGANDGRHIINVSQTPSTDDGTTTEVTNGTHHLPINRVYLAQYSSNAMLIDDVRTSTEVISECGL
jgi:hypothetical protein